MQCQLTMFKIRAPPFCIRAAIVRENLEIDVIAMERKSAHRFWPEVRRLFLLGVDICHAKAPANWASLVDPDEKFICLRSDGLTRIEGAATSSALISSLPRSKKKAARRAGVCSPISARILAPGAAFDRSSGEARAAARLRKWWPRARSWDLSVCAYHPALRAHPAPSAHRGAARGALEGGSNDPCCPVGAPSVCSPISGENSDWNTCAEVSSRSSSA